MFVLSFLICTLCYGFEGVVEWVGAGILGVKGREREGGWMMADDTTEPKHRTNLWHLIRRLRRQRSSAKRAEEEVNALHSINIEFPLSCRNGERGSDTGGLHMLKGWGRLFGGM